MTNRSLAMLGVLAALAALGIAFGLQYIAGLEPCPLCIFQRIAVAVFGLICLAAFFHAPNGLGARLYSASALLIALMGGLIALRHVYILGLPPEAVPACGPGLGTLIQVMPLREMITTVLRGDASCADVEGSFLGLSLPVWSAIYFIGLISGSLATMLRRPPNSINKTE